MTVRPQQDVLWQQRWLLLGSCAAITLAVVVLAVRQPDRWNWTLFIVGVAIGLFGLAFLESAFALIRRSDALRNSEEDAYYGRRRTIYLIAVTARTVRGQA